MKRLILVGCIAACVLLCGGCGLFGGEEEPSSSSVPSAVPTAEPTTTTVTPTTTPTTTAPVVTSIGYCTADSLNVRTGPGLDYRGIGGLVYGEEVHVIRKEGDWYCIQFGDGVGYVSAQYISGTKPAPLPSSASQTTLPTIGTDLTGTQTAPPTTATQP